MTAPNHKPISEENLNRFKAYYAKRFNWGNLIPVLRTGKIKDKDVEACKDACIRFDDEQGAALCDVLMGLSKSQRLKLPIQVASIWTNKVSQPFSNARVALGDLIE